MPLLSCLVPLSPCYEMSMCSVFAASCIGARQLEGANPCSFLTPPLVGPFSHETGKNQKLKSQRFNMTPQMLRGLGVVSMIRVLWAEAGILCDFQLLLVFALNLTCDFSHLDCFLNSGHGVGLAKLSVAWPIMASDAPCQHQSRQNHELSHLPSRAINQVTSIYPYGTAIRKRRIYSVLLSRFGSSCHEAIALLHRRPHIVSNNRQDSHWDGPLKLRAAPSSISPSITLGTD